MKTKYLLIPIIFFFALRSAAQIIHIPEDQPTIQAGINASQNGDTVLVAPGVYVENINFLGKNITVASHYLMTLDTSYISQTVIDGNQNGSVVTFDSGEDLTASLIGFTLKNGYGYFAGGGIHSRNSNLYLSNLIITSNIATGTLGYNGGGINFLGGELTIENVTISNNTSENDAAGGGIAFFGSILNIINSVISENEACNGGGIYFGGGNIILKNVIISGNTSDHGGGIFTMQTESITLINVNIVDNNAIDYEGGGIWTCSSNINIINSIIVDNSPNEILIPSSMCEDTLTISYSNLKGGINGIINNHYGLINWLEGNIDEDPIFVGTGYHPYQIKDNSPCIDSVTPDTTGLNLPFTDILGNFRIWDGDGYGTNIIDMGAYEYGSLPVYVEKHKQQVVVSKLQVFPNPSLEISDIRYQIPVDSRQSTVGRQVSLIVFDIHGQKIRMLVNEEQRAGEYVVRFNGSDMPAGVYFVRLQIGSMIETQKLVLINDY